jgi:putative phosphoribosyl transferase
MRFADRSEAGRLLAEEVAVLGLTDPVVLALPRGGLPVAEPVADRLGARLEVVVARKVGAPWHPEFGIGAIAEGGAVVADPASLHAVGISRQRFDELADAEREELDRRVLRYRGGRPLPELRGRDVVVVDDGLATGVTAEATLDALRAHHPRRLVLAVPVCSPDTAERLRGVADDVVCVHCPSDLRAVGQWYDRFDQTTDDEVLAVLDRHRRTGVAVETEVVVAQDAGAVRGDLTVPDAATGLVVFAHGSGSSRLSARNRQVAAALQVRGLATLLVDLLTEDEEIADLRSRHLRFDIELLGRRVLGALAWVDADERVAALPVGCFGASTGAAAALVAAARRPERVEAVVSRGGRPDLAGDALAGVRAPTLLIVGGADTEVLELNREAAARLHAEHRLEVVPGATHLFEEPGALEEVARLAGAWFTSRLAAVPSSSSSKA